MQCQTEKRSYEAALDDSTLLYTCRMHSTGVAESKLLVLLVLLSGQSLDSILARPTLTECAVGLHEGFVRDRRGAIFRDAGSGGGSAPRTLPNRAPSTPRLVKPNYTACAKEDLGGRNLRRNGSG